ncbi:hypothetical protein BG011_008320 [Mortierella polycephala]|uniref:Cyanovirin-N domain-containing protein n=1 Tax=Mortierella polycephala TaxID=41804 RepID=A0A9P6TX95_9FUNG|nr:hypothetical protein BG011_008320 [Mortierella polycephala]
MSGNFSQTSNRITLVDGHILSAHCRKANGEWNESKIDLNDFIGNEDGSFEWNGVNFSQTARDTSLLLGDEAKIVADLQSRDQHLKKSTLNLDERITNVDGRLVFGEF